MFLSSSPGFNLGFFFSKFVEVTYVTREEWAMKEAYYTQRLQEILIPEEVDTATIKSLISKIDRLRSEAFIDYVNAKTAYHTIDRKIDVIMRSIVQGRNDIERKANQVNAVRQYEVDGQIVDLFEIRDEYFRRFTFMESLMAQIRAKADSLITDSNVLATEAKLLA